MNKFFTLKLTEYQRFEKNISDNNLMKKSEYGIRLQEKPAKKVVDFLLNFSKSLEVRNEFSYQLN